MENQEESKIVDLIKWIKKNRKPFFTTLISVILIIIIVLFVIFRMKMIEIAASDKLDMATKTLSIGNVEQGLSIADGVVELYPNSPAAYRAMLMKANYFINIRKYDMAEPILKFYIEKAKPEIVKPIGYPLLISIYEYTGNIEQAILMSKEFLSKYSDNYLVPSVMENMARLYELSGKQEEAKQVYKELVDKFFGTIYANRASDKLN